MTRAEFEELGQTIASSDGETDEMEEDGTSPPVYKRSVSYFTVQDRHDHPEHQFLPRPSHGGAKVEPAIGLQSHPSSTHTLKAYFNSLHKERPFDATMVPVQYAECVSVATVPSHVEESYVSYCDVDGDQRCKEEVKFQEVLSPDTYQDSIVCRTNCSKKNFKSVVEYVPKFKPRKFSETCYVYPKYVSNSYVAFLDYHVDKQRKWYTTTVQLQPKTQSSTMVHNFEMQSGQEMVDSEQDESLTEPATPQFDVSMESDHETDLNMNLYNKGMHFKDGEPPHQESHRSHILVNGYIPEKTSGVEDRLHNGFHHDHHGQNGFSDDERNTFEYYGEEEVTDDGEGGDSPPRARYDDHSHYSSQHSYENGCLSDEVEL